jgi:outer membrane protein TolC
LYDGGAISAMREINKLALQIEKEDININVEQVEKLAIEVFFAILETEERTNIIQLKLEEIAATITKIKSLVTYGVMLESSLDELKIEELNAKQVLYELENNRINLIYTLSILTNKEYEENIKFVLPNDPLLASSVNNDLSVLNKLSLQKQSVLEANNLQATETVPKASLFAQAGYGKPGLNFLENQFSTYYLAGIRLNWNLSSFYNKGRNSEINSLKSQKLDALIDNQKSVLKSTIDNYNTQLLSNENQMENDKLILNMASDIKETAQYQLEQGALDMSEYIQKLNIEKEAMVNQKLHKLKDLKLKYIINHVSGNLK